jgi:hypothetical protein
MGGAPRQVKHRSGRTVARFPGHTMQMDGSPEARLMTSPAEVDTTIVVMGTEPAA